MGFGGGVIQYFRGRRLISLSSRRRVPEPARTSGRVRRPRYGNRRGRCGRRRRNDFSGWTRRIGGAWETTADANSINFACFPHHAEGTGVDLNGYLTVGGGELYVTASTAGNRRADYGIDAVIQRGAWWRRRQSGMAQKLLAGS